MDDIPVNAMNEILPPVDGKGGLYLGNVIAAEEMYYLKKFNIKALLSVAYGSNYFQHPEEIARLYIPADDTPSYDISQHFQESNEFISKHLETTNVLVHCLAGVSRSASCVIAYLMKKQGLTYADAAFFVYQRRPQIQPNEGFVEQLKQFEVKLKQSSQV